MTEPVDLSAEFLRLTRLEEALSLPLQFGPGRSVPTSDRPSRSARNALEDLLLPAVTACRCHVMFSGGRDSSALLAVATDLARRTGVPDPVPVTVRHRDVIATDETAWQTLVLDHLKIADRVELDLTDEQTLLSRVGQQALRRHGLVWPETVQLHGAAYAHLDQGSLVTGEGGDQVITSRRMTALRSVRRVGRREAIRTASPALLPAALLRRWRRAQLLRSDFAPWLTPSARRLSVESLAYASSEPLRWDRSVRQALGARADQVVAGNLAVGIREYRLLPMSPFLEPSFLDALAREGGPLGLGGRTDLMRHLFADLLPDAVLSRPTKAAFNQTRWGEAEREFARAWTGAGIDDSLIDAERLRDAWLSDDPPGAADFQLHVAWLATSGGPW